MFVATPKIWTQSSSPRKSNVKFTKKNNFNSNSSSFTRSIAHSNHTGVGKKDIPFTGIPLCFYPQGDLSFSKSNFVFQQKRSFFTRGNTTIQALQNQLNAQPNNTALLVQLLRELNRTKEYARVRSVVESQRYSLGDDQIINEYLKAVAQLGCLDQVNIKELIRAQSGGQQPINSNYMDNFTPYGSLPNPNPIYPVNPVNPVNPINPSIASNSYPINNPSNNGQNQYQQQYQQQYTNSNIPPGPGIPPNFNFNPEGPITVKIQASRWDTASRLFGALLSLGLLGAILYAIMKNQQQEEKKGNSPFNISPAHSQIKNVTARFSDVKGCDQVKDELIEVVEYLKNPNKFTQLGAKLPKGILLSGPPGTGKTLLARAIAGEAGVSFLYCSGSSFDEMFVGVGPKRVRTLFEDAKKQAPCIIFIDEIDAVGAKRSKFSLSQSKESTLNQLLTEMDGFNQTSGIMVVGATNFPQALDKALTRPGRFDKNIIVPLPDVKGRRDILDLYLKKTVPAPDVDSILLAKGTPGFSGAELANLINLAAIKATIQNKPHIDMRTLEEARDDVLVGIKRTSEQTKEDRLSTAYHEGGHALIGLLTDGTKPIHKATIVGRGNALGITWSLEREGESLTKKQALAELAMAMGGRAAEEIIYGEDNVTTGASNDIQTATYLATQMVSRWGMSERVGKVYYDLSANTANTSGLKISEREMTLISSEIKDLVEERYQFARKVLKENEPALHRIAEALMEHETLSGDELRAIVQGKPLKKEL